MLKCKLLLGVSLLMASGAWGQPSGASVGTPGNTVMSLYSVGSGTVSSVDYSLTIYLFYPLDLAPELFVSQSQLAADLKASISASKAAAPEAVFAAAVSALVKKYPQVVSANLNASSVALDLTTFKSTTTMIEAAAENPPANPAATAALRRFMERSRSVSKTR